MEPQPDKPSIPRTLANLRRWLRDTETGQRILADCYDEFLEKKCQQCRTLIPPPKVLVVARRLGRFPGVEVYAEKSARVRMIELPELMDGLGELADDLIRSMVPRGWRDVLMRCPETLHYSGESVKERMWALTETQIVREMTRWPPPNSSPNSTRRPPPKR